MKNILLVVIYFISLHLSPISSILPSCSGINDCRDPFGSICVTGQCRCKDKFPITESSGICLDYALEMDTPCWLAEQCRMIDATTCMRPSGRVLERVLDPLWDAYVESNGSLRYVPGRCRCAKGFRNVSDVSTLTFFSPMLIYTLCTRSVFLEQLVPLARPVTSVAFVRVTLDVKRNNAYALLG